MQHTHGQETRISDAPVATSLLLNETLTFFQHTLATYTVSLATPFPGDLTSRSTHAVNLGLLGVRWNTDLIDAFDVGPCAKCRLSYKATTRAQDS